MAKDFDETILWAALSAQLAVFFYKAILSLSDVSYKPLSGRADDRAHCR